MTEGGHGESADSPARRRADGGKAGGSGGVRAQRVWVAKGGDGDGPSFPSMGQGRVSPVMRPLVAPRAQCGGAHEARGGDTSSSGCSEAGRGPPGPVAQVDKLAPTSVMKSTVSPF